MDVPLIFSFWFMVAAYVIHVLDESLLGGSFVEKVQHNIGGQNTLGENSSGLMLATLPS
jgi:hypothetical protein